MPGDAPHKIKTEKYFNAHTALNEHLDAVQAA